MSSSVHYHVCWWSERTREQREGWRCEESHELGWAWTLLPSRAWRCHWDPQMGSNWGALQAFGSQCSLHWPGFQQAPLHHLHRPQCSTAIIPTIPISSQAQKHPIFFFFFFFLFFVCPKLCSLYHLFTAWEERGWGWKRFIMDNSSMTKFRVHEGAVRFVVKVVKICNS